MRFGCCADVDQLAVLEQAGYDYVELAAATVKPMESEREFTRMARRIVASRMRPETWNCLVPSQVRLVGPEADERVIDQYLATVFRRISRVGGELVVFGSGAARRVPEGWPGEKTRAQLLSFLSACADYGERYDLIVAIEPLRQAESNVLNSYVEAVSLAAEANHPRIQALADLFHFDEEGESFDHIRDNGAWLAHVHIADTNRKAPGTGTYDLPGFFGALADVGYDMRITTECTWDDFAGQAALSLVYVRSHWAMAQQENGGRC